MLVLCVLLLFISAADSSYHRSKLINDLFTKRAYNKLVLPINTEKDSLEVKFGISLQQIYGLDESNEILHTNVWYNYEWMDYNLKWNETEYGGVKSIRLPSSMIWIPDIMPYNTADKAIDSKFHTDVVVYSSGKCSWVPLAHLSTSCTVDVTYFPFDDQICTLKFGSWTYDGSKVNLTSRSQYVDVSTYSNSHEWDLLDNRAERNVMVYACCPEPYIDMTFKLHIQRRLLYYRLNLILPSMVISLIGLLTFVLPPDSGAKIFLSLSVMFAMAWLSMNLAGIIPMTAIQVPLIAQYYASLMVLSSLSVIIAVFVLHLSRSKKKIPTWAHTLICKWMAKLMLMSQNENEAGEYVIFQDFPDKDETGNEKGGSEEMGNVLSEMRFITGKMKADMEAETRVKEWKFAATVLERFFLCVLIVYWIITTIVFFAKGYGSID